MSTEGEHDDSDRFWPFDADGDSVQAEETMTRPGAKARRSGPPTARSTLLRAAPGGRPPWSLQVDEVWSAVRDRVRMDDLALLLLALVVTVLVVLALQ